MASAPWKDKLVYPAVVGSHDRVITFAQCSRSMRCNIHVTLKHVALLLVWLKVSVFLSYTVSREEKSTTLPPKSGLSHSFAGNSRENTQQGDLFVKELNKSLTYVTVLTFIVTDKPTLHFQRLKLHTKSYKD